MLKMATNYVLGSKQSSPYPSGYASGCFSHAAVLGQGRVSARLGREGVIDGHFEHPDHAMYSGERTL
jgi:hypothetical protein